MRTILWRGAAAMALLCGSPALAQDAAAPAAATPEAAPAPAPSTNAMVNLIRALVAQGALKAEAAEPLIAQAEAEAASAQATQAAVAAPAGTLRIPYVPESVRQMIRDELRADVLQAARTEGWAQPGQVAEWTRGLILSGDVRVRQQFNLYEASNFDQFIDFATVNSAGPFDLDDVTQRVNPPFLNSRQDRSRTNVRARLAIGAQLTPAIAVGMRLASGNDSSPVSTNQVLGGGFGKKDIWLDRAFVRLTPAPWITIDAGRFANPFYTNPLIWDEDVNLDGAAVSINTATMLGRGLKVAITGGAFPLEYGGLDFPDQEIEKRGGGDKWLYAGQFTVDVQAGSRIGLKAGVAYYSYDGVQGEVSEPCFLSEGSVDCSTDQARPAFLQKGNTLFALRNIIGPIGVPLFDQPQFAGLTFDYDVLNVGLDATIKLGSRYQLRIGGDYLKNLSLDTGDVCKLYVGVAGRETDRTLPPATNITPGRCPADPISAGAPPRADVAYIGGDTGWMARMSVGDPVIDALWRWNIGAEYRYLESDAVLAQFADSDFHLGGTNAEGYVISGSLGLGRNLFARARWFSGNEISGPPLAIDVMQLDLTVGF